MFTCVLVSYVVSTVLLVPKPFEGDNSVGGQLRGDKKSPFTDVTKEFRNCVKVEVAVLGSRP